MSKEQQNKAKSWEVATVRKKGDNVYLAFSEDVKITVGGRELDLGEFRTAFLKNLDEITKDLDYKVEQGWITEDQKQDNLDRLTEKNVKYALRLKFK